MFSLPAPCPSPACEASAAAPVEAITVEPGDEATADAAVDPAPGATIELVEVLSDPTPGDGDQTTGPRRLVVIYRPQG